MMLPDTVVIEVLSFCDAHSAVSWSATGRENRALLANTLRTAPEFLLRSWGKSLRCLEESDPDTGVSQAMRLIRLAVAGSGEDAIRAGFRMRPGRYRVSGWTQNTHDKNLTPLGPAEVDIDAEGRVSGQIAEGRGSRYNPAAASVWTGSVEGGRATLEDGAPNGNKFRYSGEFSASHRVLRGTYSWERRPHISALGAFELRFSPLDHVNAAAGPWARAASSLVAAPTLRAFGIVTETGAVGGVRRTVAAERARAVVVVGRCRAAAAARRARRSVGRRRRSTAT